jgi:NAD(P)-dependent dehydrogenase (short-subunit alcohol dehydrogenase family)
VNAAGTAITQPFLEVTPEAWEAVFAVNLRAVMFLSQAVAKRWCNEEEQQQSGRAIVSLIRTNVSNVIR